jgi:hypothetical protein
VSSGLKRLTSHKLISSFCTVMYLPVVVIVDAVSAVDLALLVDNGHASLARNADCRWTH